MNLSQSMHHKASVSQTKLTLKQVFPCFVHKCCSFFYKSKHNQCKDNEDEDVRLAH